MRGKLILALVGLVSGAMFAITWNKVVYEGSTSPILIALLVISVFPLGITIGLVLNWWGKNYNQWKYDRDVRYAQRGYGKRDREQEG